MCMNDQKKKILDVNILCSLFVYTRFRKIKDELSTILRINLVVGKTAKLKSKTCPFAPCPPSSHNWPSQFISTPPWVELSQNLPPPTREKKDQGSDLMSTLEISQFFFTPS